MDEILVCDSCKGDKMSIVRTVVPQIFLRCQLKARVAGWNMCLEAEDLDFRSQLASLCEVDEIVNPRDFVSRGQNPWL